MKKKLFTAILLTYNTTIWSSDIEQSVENPWKKLLIEYQKLIKEKKDFIIAYKELIKKEQDLVKEETETRKMFEDLRTENEQMREQLKLVKQEFNTRCNLMEYQINAKHELKLKEMDDIEALH